MRKFYVCPFQIRCGITSNISQMYHPIFWKRLNIFFKPLLLTGIFSNLLIGEDSIIDSVFNSLFIHPGKYALELSQDYITSENFSSAELYILDRKNLFIRLSDFDLLLKENSFFSFYSNQKTVVIDKYINTEFNLISILTKIS